MKQQRFLSFAIAALLAITAPLEAQTPASAPQIARYQIDTVHSELTFRIRHLLGRVNGTFGEWSGVVTIDESTPANSSVTIDIKSASIDTRVTDRDNHLRTPDFFDAKNHPLITFRSTNVTVQGRTIRLVGDLSIRGRTKPVVFVGTYEGKFKDPWGKTRTAFLASATINRQDFGVSYNGPFEKIGQIGDEVWIEIAIEAVQIP